MVNVPPLPEWPPRTPPVEGGDFRAWPVLVLHYWAIWDHRLDREMDGRLTSLREEYAGRICFRSCDTDRAENLPFVQGIENIPALGCFIGGRWHESLVGLRPESELRRVFDLWLAATLPGDPPSRRSGVARVVSTVSEFLRRGRAR